ncbi:MAG TPA: lysophospholipid acyltransferase family protein [Bacteroidales bacterium]|nr:lysophospholipid acyltransferase family protein [Bacteroidales bacterium]
MSFGYFESTGYKSPERKKSFLNWLCRDNWLFFFFGYGKIVFRTRNEARSGRYGDREWSDSSFEIFRLLERLGGRFDIEGMENINKTEGPVVFLSNHMSTLETMILPSIIRPHREVTFVVKESLVRHPLFMDVMKSRNPIVVGRTDPRKDFETVMNEGPELLARGTSIIIFPQSTRSEVFVPSEFNSLGVKLAKKAGVPVVPVAIKTDFWGNGKIIKEIGKLDHTKTIHIKFTEPLMITGNGKDENQKVISFIEENLKEWNATR